MLTSETSLARILNRHRFLAAWMLLVAVSFWVAPIPAVNEPHYLTKARHYWQPDWNPHDFFLASPPAHTVFYWVMGPIVLVVGNGAAAALGRVLACGLLAAGWLSFANRVLAKPEEVRPQTTHSGSPSVHGVSGIAELLALVLFLGIQAIGNLSGEWLVGGIEAKVVTYAGFLWAFGLATRSDPHTNWSATLFGMIVGLSVAMHPVVGGWIVLAVLGSFLFQQLASACLSMWSSRRSENSSRGDPVQSPGERPSDERPSHSRQLLFTRRQWAVATAAASVTAPWGLVPAIQLLLTNVPPETRFAGTYIQVYYRLAHHLDPMTFPAAAWAGYAALLCVWLVGACVSGGFRTGAARWWFGIVLASVLFAGAGLLVGYGARPAVQMPGYDWRMHLLKFYPFRLVDLLLPIAVAVLLAGQVCRGGRWPAPIVTVLSLAAILVVPVLRVDSQTRPSPERIGAWNEACQWIASHLPETALVQTPHSNHDFKWRSGRAEYVSFKDCPQDAAGIVEWNRRLVLLTNWYQSHYADGLYSASELAELRQREGITHVLTDRLGPMEVAPVYQNRVFHVYELPVGDRPVNE